MSRQEHRVHERVEVVDEIAEVEPVGFPLLGPRPPCARACVHDNHKRSVLGGGLACGVGDVSSAAAEIYAASVALSEICHLSYMTEEMGMEMPTPPKGGEPNGLTTARGTRQISFGLAAVTAR